MPISQTVYYGSSSTQKKSLSGIPQLEITPSEESINIHGQTSLEELTKQMYKQNVELAVVNKTLRVIRALYSVTIESLEVEDVTQRLVDTIVKELNLTAVLISLIDEQNNILKPIAITRSAEIIKALEYLGKPLESFVVGLDNLSNLAINVVKDKERKITGNLLDILVPHVRQRDADKVEEITGIKTLILYPILLGEKCLGVINIALAKKVDDLSRVQRETLEQLLNVVSTSLDRAQLYENLKIANEKLKELDKLKDEFVSLASHELRSPMTTIKGSLSTILDGYAGEVSKETREFLTAAYSENDRLIRLVNNLLNISRIESGRLKFLVTNVDMSKLMKDEVDNMQMAAKERGLTLTIDKTENLPLVLADEDKIREVLINLLGNAIKFTHQGGITVSAKVDKDMVVTSVTDTGNGIAPEDQDLLFKKFSQVRRGTYSRQTGGTGLGLYISKKIIEGLQGQIWLTSTVGKGTTFFFSLPIIK
ncbi:MAG: Sensor protein resE [Candidatus Gottesmanbacteria bacterium GW2011_GWA1_43_11]|uniref:histidine kinase n=1 Tax=Candidatus Gottesmanbacteria bacterium GW2011_GWA1_43_11 TaxID=1618436 RepID=A0A0G1CFK6_9BACT|nr:MAG: Sensor protein resE [Candidatus Gottesmanbacteria bacterium GW2011_GWA1_43_11]